MAADITRVTKRVLDILNASDAGTYSATVSSRNKTRAQASVDDAIIEAGLQIVSTIAAYPNEFRAAFVAPVNVTHGQLLPDHLGAPVYVEIQKYASADWTEAKQKNYLKVQSLRRNESKIYDKLDHDVNGSSLSGYADIWERKVYFTGYAARVGLATAVRADVATKIPDILEPTLIKLSAANCLKAGEGAYLVNIAESYFNKAQFDLAEFRGGKRTFREVSTPEPTSEVHQ